MRKCYGISRAGLLSLLLAAGVMTSRGGVVLRLFYDNVTGTAVSDLTNASIFPTGATYESISTNGITFHPASPLTDYGTYTRGYIEAPVTGDYVFYVASDDASQFWFSTNADPANATLVAHEDSCCTALFSGDRLADRSSDPIHLERGQKYFFKLLGKQGGGGEFEDVGWQMPDGTKEIVPGYAVAPFPLDLSTFEPASNVAPTILATYGQDTYSGSPYPIPNSGQPQSTTVVENQPVRFVVTSEASEPASFQWKKNGQDIPDAILSSYYIPAAALSDNGATFTVTITNAFGSVTSQAATLTVTPDTTAPTVVAASSRGTEHTISVVFSEKVDEATATNTANYQITGGTLTLTGGKLLSDGKTVELTTQETIDSNTAYSIQVSNVKDLAATPNTMQPATLDVRKDKFFADFNGGILPEGATLNGNATLDSDALRLTEAQGSENGTIVIPDLDNGKTVGGFLATFKVKIDKGSGTPADGMSLSFGPDITSDSNFGEEGGGSGFRLEIDTYDNGGNEAPAFNLWSQGQIVASDNVAYTNIATGDQFVPVRVHVAMDGKADVTYNGNVIFTNVFSFLPTPGRFAIGARTGGQYEEHYIDDLSLTTYVVPGPYVSASSATPTSFSLTLNDTATQVVNADSIKATLDGADISVKATKSGSVTTIEEAGSTTLASDSTHTVILTYTYGQGTAATNEVNFRVLTYASLDTGLATALGSGDASQPGFNYRVVQTASSSATANWENSDAQSEVNLAGGLDPYTDPSTLIYSYTGTTSSVPATLTYTVGADGYLAITNVINFNHNAVAFGGSADIGDFQGPTNYDLPIPGLPVSTLSDDSAADYVTAEALTYVEFPQAGLYQMGVNSDDGFRVSCATNQDYPVKLITVNSPASIATNMFGIEAQFSPALPQLADVGPITGNVVEAQPADGSAALTNPDAIKGNIALIDRGAVTFAEKIGYAEDAGAIAVIVADSNNPGDLIITMSNNGETRTIPAVMTSYSAGQALHTALQAGQTVNVTLHSHSYTNLGYFDNGRGSSDTVFNLFAPKAGVYPLRLMWYNGTGGANCEWFTVNPDGSKTLINDANDPNALKAFRARANTPIPTAGPTLGVSLSGNTLTFTWSGSGFVLQSTPTLTNPTWTNVSNGDSSPATDQVNGNSKFYRLASP